MRQDSLVVEGSNIIDLDIEPEAPLPAPLPAPAPAPRDEPGVDPAILSYARPPTSGQVSAISHADAQHSVLQEASQPSVSPAYSLQRSSVTNHQRPKGDFGKLRLDMFRNGQEAAPSTAEPSAILTEPFNDLSLHAYPGSKKGNNVTPSDPADISQVKTGVDLQPNALGSSQKAKGKRSRRKNAGGKENGPRGQLPASTVMQDGLVTTLKSTPKAAMGPGWRETPLTETRKSPDANSAQIQTNIRVPPSMPELLVPGVRDVRTSKRSRRQRQAEFDDQNGWATGEATDIQDMGDFDFEENHKKFDKKKVFEQIRQDDTTADEARLVNFNRLPARLGTHGGKNLHYTENVLDSPTRNLAEHSSDSDMAVGETKNARGSVIRRASSQASHRKVPSRKGSAPVGSDGQMAVPGILPNIREDRTNRVFYEAPVSSNPSIRSHKSASQRRKRALRTAVSDYPCRCVTPLQMLELEHLAISELGISEDMIIENAAIAIAQTARKLAAVNVEKLSRKKRGRKIVHPLPLVVVLVGNHKTGSRAIAAARQLRNHDAQVLLCVLGLEREADLLDSVRRQLSIFRKCGGQIVRQSQLMEALKDFHVSSRTQPSQLLATDLIIDAMLGMHLSFEDLRMEDQTAYSQLVQWANMCDVTTLSIDVPSGVDASTGETPDPSNIARLQAEASRIGVILQGEPELVIEAHHVLSLGAPKIGLLLGKESVTSFQNHHGWLVADIGLGETVWRKSGLRGEGGVDFGGEWVTKLDFIPEVEK